MNTFCPLTALLLSRGFLWHILRGRGGGFRCPYKPLDHRTAECTSSGEQFDWARITLITKSRTNANKVLNEIAKTAALYKFFSTMMMTMTTFPPSSASVQLPQKDYNVDTCQRQMLPFRGEHFPALIDVFLRPFAPSFTGDSPGLPSQSVAVDATADLVTRRLAPQFTLQQQMLLLNQRESLFCYKTITIKCTATLLHDPSCWSLVLCFNNGVSAHACSRPEILLKCVQAVTAINCM